MKVPILNDSHLDTDTVRSLVAFAAPFYEYAGLAYLHVRTKSRKNSDMSDGRAFHHDPTEHGRAFFAPSRVQIDLVDRRRYARAYPLKTCHPEVPEAVGDVVLLSPEEEFLFILAHELRHIDQFWNGGGADEADAEKFAFKVLGQFRKLLDRALAA